MSITRNVFLKGAGVALGIFLLFSLAVNAQTIYVTPEGNGTGNGSSWANAMGNAAFTAALQSAEHKEFWVKEGTYKPATTDRNGTFRIGPGVLLFGGFAGNETALDQRNPAANVTILSGDIDNDGSLANNSYHVVTGDIGLVPATFDGFTVTGGNADGAAFPINAGGGMFNRNCLQLTVNNCTFSGNYARDCGAGMYNEGSSTPPTSSVIIVTNCTFSSNAAYSGGGIFSTYSIFMAINCTFSDNRADCYAGGVLNDNSGNSGFVNCTFSGNSHPNGENVTYGGGMTNIRSTITMAHCTFFDNRGNYGKGMFNNGDTAVTMTSCIFWDPYASSNSSEILNDNNSTAAFSYCLVRGWDGGTGNINPADPGLGPLADNGGPTKTHALLPGSPALNTGDPGSTLAPTDQRGMTRPQASGFDMGAFELGSAAISGSAGTAGAVLSYTDGTAKTVTADGSGNYSFSVSDDWSGTVTPTSLGYAFSPTYRSYAHVVTNQINQNYIALTTYAISGTIADYDDVGIAGVVLSYNDGTAKTATTDGSGNYSFFVSGNWTGTVTPAKVGYGFYPTFISYTNVLANKPDQDYLATAIMPTIMGTIKSGGIALSGVVLHGLPNTPTTNAQGQYKDSLTYGWSGTATPTLAGYTFSPAAQAYANVVTDTTTDYTATINHYTITATAGAGGAITPSGEVDVTYAGNQDFAITPDPHYRISDVLIDGVSAGAVSSYSFANVTSNHTIAASFAIIQYTITTRIEEGHGTASPALQSVNSGETALIRLVPDTGYKLGYLSDNGNIVNPVTEYQIHNVDSDHRVIARFENSPPLVEISQPGDGAFVTGVVEVKARIEDDGKIQRAEFFVDGTRRQTTVVREEANSDPGSAIAEAAKTWQLTTAEMRLEFGPGPLLVGQDRVLWRLDESGALLPALSPGRKVSHVQRLQKTDALLFVFAEPCLDSAGARSRVQLLNRASGTLRALLPESFATPLLLANNPVFQEDEQGGVWFVKSVQNGSPTELWKWNRQNGPERIATVPFVPLSWQLLSDAEVMFQEGTLHGARRWLLSGNELCRVDDNAAHLVGNGRVAGYDAAAAESLENGFSARFGSRSFGLSGNSLWVRDMQSGTVVEISAAPWEPCRVAVAGKDSFLILGRDPRRKIYGLLRLGWDEAGAGIEELAEFAADPACAAELEAGNDYGAAGSERGRSIGMADSGEWTFHWDSGPDQAGAHVLRVVAVDDAGATGMDEVRVNLAKVKLSLSVVRKTVRSWSMLRHYGQIELLVETQNTQSLRFRLQRRNNDAAFTLLQEFGESELQSGAWSFQDKYLDKNQRFTYMVEALDSSGRVLGRSFEITI